MIKDKISTFKQAIKVKAAYGKSYSSQFRDIVKLRLGPPKLSACEYYQFGLYDDGLFPFSEKAKFLGWRGRTRIDRAFNAADWRVITSDKIVTDMLLKQLQLPSPRILAAYDVRARNIPGLTHLGCKKDLRKFLKTAPYPIFIKPVDAGEGRGAMKANEFDEQLDCLIVSGGQLLSTKTLDERFAAEADRGRGGYIFQEVVRAAPETKSVAGGRLIGLRLIVLLGDEPLLTHAVIKFPTGDNITDNFCGGRGGNLIGKLDPRTGTVERVFGLAQEGYAEARVHPDTGHPLPGFTVPDWENYRSLLLRAASAFPALRLQHWDVAIAEGGPQFLELNADGCLELPQIAYQQGFFGGPCAQEFMALQKKKCGGAASGRRLLRLAAA